ncbi:TPA: 6,7-dimethyl-8-ribityllumazine synthase [Candidatus Micrarchaeota archaeon]|nr:6,7-dimethyl-8-ribityllumazine synthase [Candidatus Micrarchaeota archaeon]
MEKTQIAMVRSEFNQAITGKMQEAALKQAKKRGAAIREIILVPGAFDMPLALRKALENKKTDAVVALGAIVKGGTKHDETIAFALAKTVHELELQYGKPIGFGVMGPGVSLAQAQARAKGYAERAVDAALTLTALQKEKK